MAEDSGFRREQIAGRPTIGGYPMRRNQLLTLIPDAESARVEAHLEQVDFAFREHIYRDGEQARFAYFPHAGVLSMISLPHEENGLVVEVATVGWEGVVGVPLLLGAGTMPGECFCQVDGQAARIPATVFQELAETLPSFRRVLLRYTQALITQIAQAAACNRMHPIEERCARWLLMTQDRVGADHFRLTQEFLAQMLGVRRPSVTVAANILQKAGLITYSRGLIVVTNRKGLEAASCNCYRVINHEFQRLVG